MANLYWTGTSGQSWSSHAQWSLSPSGGAAHAEPTTGDTAIFNKPNSWCKFDINASCDNITVTAQHVQFTSIGAKTVTVDGMTGDDIFYWYAAGTLNCNTISVGVSSRLGSSAWNLVIPSGTVTIHAGTQIKNCAASGGATFDGTGAIDLGGNSGWVFDTPTIHSGTPTHVAEPVHTASPTHF
jgi:hypothetical protein